MIVSIEVTQEDINNGIPGDPCGCAVAIAVKRAFGVEHVYANADGIVIPDNRLGFLEGDYAIEDEVVEFMDMFDGGFTVTPFSFELNDK